MTATAPEAPLAEMLRRAGHDLPAEVVADLLPGHALLQAMLARLPSQAPPDEPATVFRPGATDGASADGPG
jgi:hypothetical protein